MYTAPDFVKVSVKAKDIFSGYQEHCPMDEYHMDHNTVPCDDSDPNYWFEHDTYVGMGMTYMCYGTLNP